MQFSTVFFSWWYMYHWWYMEVNCISKIVVNVFMCKKNTKYIMKLNWKNTNYIILMSSVPCGSCNCPVHDVGM
jgi:hypothetical protein